MSGNTWGDLFKVTIYGESHGEMIGMVIDGCPAGLKINFKSVEEDLRRRRPGQSKITTSREEPDLPHFVSGIFEGITTGTPIAGHIKNQDQRSQDYSHIASAYRPSHADFTYDQKYGHRDHRGGGRSSARETAARVMAGSIAKQLLNTVGVKISAYVSQVGSIELTKKYSELDLKKIESNLIRCPDSAVAKKMISEIEKVKSQGDTIGGVITGVITGCPVGLGSPVFDKLHADLGKAMLSINAVKGFEYGSGFEGVKLKGSEHNDVFHKKNKKMVTLTNHSGGVQGGISNGMDIYFRVAFKPVATLIQDQKTTDKNGKAVIIKGKGRHDPCVVPRAVPIVEAMAAIVLADHYLRMQTSKMSTLVGQK
ncbi:MAG: chorismate synthase [Bacteriovoracaceae bacterium]|nr:chorismate synthase [Bacteriovoracaceae bacterium]